MSYYQLGHVVDDDQVGPGVSEAEVGLVVNATELTDPAEENTQRDTVTHSAIYIRAQ